MGATAAALDLGTGGPGPMAVLALSGLDPVALPEPSLVEVIGLLDEQVAWLHSVRSQHLAELARRHVADRVMPDLEPGEWREGRAELPQWERESVGLRCGVTAYEARARVETAVALESRLPVTSALLALGGVSWAHAVARVQETGQLDAARAGQVERAVHADGRAVTAGQVRRRARRLAAGLLPPVDPDQVVERSLTGWSDESSCTLQVRLDREGGEIVARCLNSLATRTGADDLRCAATRRADALVEVCRARLDAGDLPLTAAGVRPHLTLQVSLASLHAAPADGAADGGAGAGGGVCTSCGALNGLAVAGRSALGIGAASGAAGLAADLPVETVRRLGCDASISALVHNGTVLDLGREHRFPTPGLRRRLEARDGGCRFPTCERGARRCHAHHVVHWADGGVTDASNLLLLCARHHYLVHEGGWRLTFDGLTAVWNDPAGREYEARSPLARPPDPDPDFYVWLPAPQLSQMSQISRLPPARAVGYFEPADPDSQEPPPF